MKGKSLEGNALFPDRPDSLILILLPFLLFRYHYYFSPFLATPVPTSCNGLSLYFYYDSHLSFPIVEFFGRGEFNHLGNF